MKSIKTKLILLGVIIALIIGGTIAFFTIKNKNNNTRDSFASALI